MKIEYRQAAIEDAEALAKIYNASFYDDCLRFGSCPGYGQTKESTERDSNVELARFVAER